MSFRKAIFPLLFVALIVAAFSAFYFWVIKPSRDILSQASRSIAEGIEKVFGGLTPRVSINSVVVIKEQIPIFEVAVLKQNVYHEFTSTDTWLGSTKELHLKGVFIAKAGFDLTARSGPDSSGQNLSINLEENKREGIASYHVTLLLPPPKLLSFETEKYEVVKAEDGWWNLLSEQDFESALNAMKSEARDQALAQGMLEKTKLMVQDRLETIIRSSRLGAYPLTIEYLWQEETAPSDSTPEGEAILK